VGDGKQDSEAPPTVDLGPATGPDRGPTPAPPRAHSPFDRDPARFETRGELGRGGMGRVEDAFDRSLARPVAIKHMLSHSDVDFARFEREAKITARLEHPGIVPVHEAGRGSDGTPYYVMRRVDGRPLQERVTGASPEERLALIPNVLAACDAVAFAHANGVIHRDIKPTNILVGPFGETLVIDWGLARESEPGAHESGSAIPISDQALTRAGTVAGTPGFMAPEQARGDDVDERADVYALGATLFYVLAGRSLYSTARATELVDLAGAARPPDWSALPARVPADLRAILAKALAGDRAARYRDAGELAADLRRFVTGNLVGAHEYGALDRIVRFVRRHRAVLAVAAASAVVLAIVATLSIRRVVAERDDANAARALAESRQRDALAAADRLLVQHAQVLADTDPVGAIALLRTLSPSSTRWREAWLAAVAAWSRGVPFGFVGEEGMLFLQIAGDNRHLVTSTRHTGHLIVFDLVARTRRVAATVPGAMTVTWMGPDHIACMGAGGELYIANVANGTVRDVGFTITTLLGDRKTRAVALTETGRVVELADPDADPRVIADGVREIWASPDLAQIALARGNKLSVWRANGELAIPDAPPDLTFGAIQSDMLLAMAPTVLRAWRITGDRAESRGSWPRETRFTMAAVGDQIYATSYNGLELLGDPVVPLHAGYGSMYSTARGFISIGTDNGLVEIHDVQGVVALGPFAFELHRPDVSLDGRYVAVLTGTADVLVWDVAALRPRRVTVELGERPVKVTAKSLWTTNMPELWRHDLATGEHQAIGDDIRPGGHWYVSEDETWAAMQGGPGSRVQIVAVPSGTIVASVEGVTTWTPSARGIDLARTDGSISRWEPGWTELRSGERFPEPVLSLARSGDASVAGFSGGKLVRELPGASESGHIDGTIDLLAIVPDGTTWITDDVGRLYRWPVGGTIALVDVAEPVIGLWLFEGRPVAHTARSLIELDLEPIHPVPSDAMACAPMGDHLAACVSAQYELSILDLKTGGRIQLHRKASDREITAAGDTIVYPDFHKNAGLWTISVPRDAAALQAWLRDVTNAKPVPGSDVVAWP
jgi:hypothetical protein